jgi:hypothetical protein
MKTKTCESCKLDHPCNQFYVSSKSLDGLYPRCKGCCHYYNSKSYRNQKATDKQPIIETTPLRVVNEQFLHRNLGDNLGSFEPLILNIKDSSESDLNLRLEINPLINFYRSIFTNTDGKLIKTYDCIDVKSLLNFTAYYLADRSLYCSLKGVENVRD